MLVSKDMRLKVTDFGIARALESISHGEKSDVVWGSPLYFAPEQAAGESPTPASDVYSLGVVMYELFSGTPPFTASSAEELARLHISGRPVPISEYVPDIPSALEEIVMKVLSKEPAARYRTADQLGRVLQRFGTMPDPPPVQQQPVLPQVITIQPDIAERLAPPPIQPFQEQTYALPQYIPPRPTPQPVPVSDDESNSENVDWVSVGLGLLAVIAVGGLIPFYLLVYLTFFPPN
jgi:serine/threonine-protein kinase